MSVESLITQHIDIWTSAVQTKSTAGRGTSSKLDLYGIKKLREMILELAVRGKLVSQDPNDEPASVLLDELAAIKNQLIKNKIIKKNRKQPEISEEEKRIALPTGWKWARLEDVYDVRDGTHDSPKPQLNGYPLVTSKNLSSGVLDLSDVKYISEEDHLKVIERSKVDKFNILFAMIGSIGNPVIVDTEVEFSIKNVGLFKYYDLEKSCPRYLVYFLRYAAEIFRQESSGGVQPFVSLGKLRSFAMALPPLEEQHRIVAKVDELMKLCDQLEQQTEASIAAHQVLVETLLATLTNSKNAEELMENWQRISAHFDTLFTTIDSIDQLKQTILQLAVMGKLVPQNPADEPACELYNRLSHERDKWLDIEASAGSSEAKTMQRKLKKLKVPKAPFSLPQSWTCVHLIQLSRMLVDCHNKTAPYVNTGIPIIRTSNIRERKFVSTDLKYISQDTYDYWSRRCPPQSGDIIFTREAPMGEALIIPEGNKWCLGQRTMLVRPMHQYVLNEYLLLALTEPNLLQRASEHAVGLTVKHLRVGDVENLNLPLPPLKEQQRIVSKVEELFTICELLKISLSTNQSLQLKLTDSFVDQVG